MELDTERLHLRELRLADAAAVHGYASDPEAVRYLEFGPNTEDETEAFVRAAMDAAQLVPRTTYTSAIVRQGDEVLLGTVTLRVLDDQYRLGGLGYALARPYWGVGYATEAATAVAGFGFRELGLGRIVATCDPANVASARVLVKVGMTRECRLRDHLWIRGRWRDRDRYVLLPVDWQSSSRR